MWGFECEEAYPKNYAVLYRNPVHSDFSSDELGRRHCCVYVAED